MNPNTAQRLTLFIFLGFTIWLGFYLIQPPEPKSKSSQPTEFSAERAFQHVRQIAKMPHPLGSAANDSVRKYILDELRKMELKPTVQDGIGVGSIRDRGLIGYTKNIFAKLAGSNPEKTLLLMAHYDSVPNAPGAGDDASGVAAILETVRALQSREAPLKNNIWILFTDGEERGLLGAELFAKQFDELDQIDLVLNFEARGSSGPSMMFETSSPNGGLIPHFAKATSHPVANSLMYTVYKLLPNDTDLSAIKRAGLNGINFAFAESFLNYHTMQDTPENLSLASLQHHGSNMLSTVRHFGDINFNLESSTEYVYFNNATGGLIYYPAGWSFPLALVTALLFVAYLIFLFRTGKLNLVKYLGSILLFVIVIAIGAGITYFGWQAIKLWHPAYQWLQHGENYGYLWYLWGFTLLILGLFSGIYGFSWIREKLSIQQLLSGSYTIWVLLSLVNAWHLPAAAYLFTWPVLLGLVGWIVLGSSLAIGGWKTTAFLALSLAPVFFLVPPYLYLIQVMLTTEMLAVSMVLLLLLLGLAWPAVWQLTHPHKKIWNSILVAGALACFLIASASSGYDAQHKKQNDLNYVQNLKTDQAYWVSRDHTTDAWTKQFLGSHPENGSLPGIQLLGNRKLLYRQAESRKIAPPQFEITADSSADSLRFITMQIAPQKGIGMSLEWGKQTIIRGISFRGTTIYDSRKEGKSANSVIYFKDLSEATEVHIRLKAGGQSAKLNFSFFGMGLPTKLIPNYQPRSDDMMPKPYWISNASIWQTAVDLDTLTRAPERKALSN